ncbi:MAG: DJ-1/PfpI family protein [Sphingopyxis solisilvae]|uniref:DJ-1/PfpI family protein n=1 Tax=Sphingopyxis solisilvae TaxID=1886788 RepID=UPI0040361DEE
MKVTIFLFDGVTALDPIGVYDPLARLPNTEIAFVSETGNSCRTGDGFLSLTPSAKIGDIHSTDILLVPGGSADGIRQCIANEALRADIARLDRTATITASVCSGALILGASGLLRGRKATTHWRAKDYLAQFGAEYTGERVTRAEKYWTSAGVTAGIDLGIAICAHIAGDELAAAVELSMEYDPKPRFSAGSHHSAPAERQRIVTDVLRG